MAQLYYNYLYCVTSTANACKREAFSIRTYSPSELQSLPRTPWLSECVFGNLSNFTLVKFSRKRQHFSKKPPGWVNVISNGVEVGVAVLDLAEINLVREDRGSLDSPEDLLLHSLGSPPSHLHNALPYCCLHSCDKMRRSAVCCCGWSQTSAGTFCLVCFMLMIMAAFCLFLCSCASLSLFPSLCNLCVVVGAGADRPRDGI